MTTGPIVVIGGGHAAAQLCAAMAKAGAGARMHVVCEEATPPYHRPPLSKNFLLNAAQEAQLLQQAAWYAAQGIDVHMGDAAVRIDRAAQAVHLASGARLAYEKLVIATGSRARELPGLDRTLSNILMLRTLADASALRERLQGLARDLPLTVLGGGFIGLEVAASARQLGRPVHVLEAAARLMARAVSPELSARVASHHAQQGIAFTLNAQVQEFVLHDGRLAGVRIDGALHEVDELLVGIGAVPDVALAQACGLTVDNGICVDGFLATSDPDILAIGDCTAFEYRGRHARLESVHNANEQARLAAMVLLGTGQSPYRPVPTFWSDQGRLKLQMVGLWQPALQAVVRPGTGESLSVFHYDGAALVAVESLNAPGDHILARRLLERGISPTPAQAADSQFALKTLT
jgi:3-phenylpropionate/trans-cinnamate dioxygenase ferredoxin reductase subunit